VVTTCRAHVDRAIFLPLKDFTRILTLTCRSVAKNGAKTDHTVRRPKTTKCVPLSSHRRNPSYDGRSGHVGPFLALKEGSAEILRRTSSQVSERTRNSANRTLRLYLSDAKCPRHGFVTR